MSQRLFHRLSTLLMMTAGFALGAGPLTFAVETPLSPGRPSTRQDPADLQEQEIRADCRSEAEVHCPQANGLIPLAHCLEDYGENLSSRCLDRLTPISPGLRARLERRAEAAARASTEATARAAAAAATQAAEATRLAEEARIRGRFEQCREELQKDPDEYNRRMLHSLCIPFSRRPPLNQEENACTALLLRSTGRTHRKPGRMMLYVTEEFENACRTFSSNPAALPCTERRLKAGAEPYEALGRCEEPTIRCETFLKGNRPSSPKLDKFLKKFCLQYSAYFQTSEECAAPELARVPERYPTSARARDSASAEIRARCIARLEARKPFLQCIHDTFPSRWRFLWDLPMLTHLCEQDPVYRECVIPRFFNLPDHIQNLSYPSSQEQQQEIHQACLVQSTLRAFDERNRREQKSSCP